jgi:amino-acid N-acetyltransferase
VSVQLLSRPAAAPSRRRRSLVRAAEPVTYRAATAADAPALHALIARYAEEGRLLPRHLDDLVAHAPRFVVAVSAAVGGRSGPVDIVGCAELAPLSDRVAEVRSLVVASSARGAGVGRGLIADLRHRTRQDGYAELCAFTHEAAYFVRLGFSIVPHAWVPEKIARDCQSCHLFRRCGQHAVVLSIGRSAQVTAAGPQAAAAKD